MRKYLPELPEEEALDRICSEAFEGGREGAREGVKEAFPVIAELERYFELLEYRTIKQVAADYDRSEWWVRNMIKKGHFKEIYAGRISLISLREDLEKRHENPSHRQ